MTNTTNIAQEYLRPVMTWVNSEDEVKNAYVVPGTIGFYMDRNNPRFYIKEGMGSYRTFEFKEILPKPEATTQYVTEEKFYAAIEDLKNYISNHNRKIYKNNRENNDAKPTV